MILEMANIGVGVHIPAAEQQTGRRGTAES